MTNDRDDLLTGWRSPPAPPQLRRRALAAARDGSSKPTRRRLEDRLWESRPARYGWLAAASLLLFLNLAVGFSDRPTLRALNHGAEFHQIDDGFDIGISIPQPTRAAWTLAEAQQVVRQILTDPCLDPLIQGDCT